MVSSRATFQVDSPPETTSLNENDNNILRSNITFAESLHSIPHTFDFSEIIKKTIVTLQKHPCYCILHKHLPNTLLFFQKPTLETWFYRYNLLSSFHSSIPIPWCDCQPYRRLSSSKYSFSMLEWTESLGIFGHLLYLYSCYNLFFKLNPIWLKQ